METQLLELLNYRDVLAAVASTRDGLLVAAVGLDDDDAEALAAAGSAVAAVAPDDPLRAVQLDGGLLVVASGQELMLVVLSESDAAADPLSQLLFEKVQLLDGILAGVA